MILRRKYFFNFSGKSLASSPLEAEKQAILFLHQKFRASTDRKCFLQLYKDSKTLAQEILQERAGVTLNSPILREDDWEILVKDMSTKVSYVIRDKLLGANKRAKEGKLIQSFIFA